MICMLKRIRRSFDSLPLRLHSGAGLLRMTAPVLMRTGLPSHVPEAGHRTPGVIYMGHLHGADTDGKQSRSFTPLNHPNDEDLSLGTSGKTLRSG